MGSAGRWHHVHALDGEGVSLSLWYQHDRDLAEYVAGATQPDGSGDLGGTRYTLRVRVAREAEETVAAAIGPRHVRSFFLRLAWRCTDAAPPAPAPSSGRCRRRSQVAPAEYEGAGEDEAEEMEPKLQAWLLRRLGEILGEAEVNAFVRLYLGPSRFDGLP